MALDIGSRLGHYDVTALIGEGDGTGLKPLCRVLPDAAADLNPGAERREATSRRVPINAFSSVERGPSGSVGRP